MNKPSPRPLRRHLILLALLGAALLPDLGNVPSAAVPRQQKVIINGVLASAATDQPAPEPESLVVDPPPAGSTVINFDDVAVPCLFQETTALRARYAALGVLFSGPGARDGGAIINQCGAFGVSGHSSPNFLGFNTAAVHSDGGGARGPETITFSPAVGFVQINGGSGSSGTITMTAFNQGGTPLGSASRSGSSALQTLAVTAPGIARVVIEFSGTILVLDDLAFLASPDRDGDGLTDEQEAGLGTDPDDPDTDDDLLLDGFEVEHGFDPLAPGEAGQDPDGDGLDNLAEQAAGTNPRDADSDDDGLGDGQEVTLGTLPGDADTDNDGLSDGEEVLVHGTDPLRADTDGGGVSDGLEVNRDHTDPLDPADDRKPSFAMVMDNLSDRAIVFDPANDTVIASVPLGGNTPVIGDCVISADGSTGFATDFNARLWAVDLAAQPPRLADPPNPIPIANPGEDVALSGDGKFLVVCDGTAPGPMSVVDVATRLQRSTFPLPLNSRCVTVDVCDDGSVLAGSDQNAVRRLRLDSSGNLSDTGEVLTILSVQNVYCAPGSRSGLVVSSTQGTIRSFTVPGLAPVHTRTLTGGSAVAAALTADGDRVFARSPGGSIDAFQYDPLTGALGSAPLFTLQNTGFLDGFYGIDQIAVHPSNDKLYVGGQGIVRIFDARTGAALGSITHPDIRQPTGICVRTSRDRDGDGLRDDEEEALGTNPDDPDTDDDGLLDGFEVRNGFDPLSPGDQAGDPDGDGLDNLAEQGAGTNPRDPDSDDDGLGDGQEVTLGTNPIDPDTDHDGHLDGTDNCPLVGNPGQQDIVHPNGIGDACDDPDGDSIFDASDNCPGHPNPGQENADGDVLGDACDPCPADPLNDADGDGFCASADNCPARANPDQADGDGDHVGDLCDSCPAIANPGQDEETACIGVTEDGGLCLETQIDLVLDDLGGSLTILKNLSVPPGSLRFEVLDTACAAGDTFVFILNGFILGNLPADPTLSCGCLSTLQAFSVTDQGFLAAHWNVGGNNSIVVRKIGSAAAVSWVRLVVEKFGDTASSCLLDIGGGGCDVMDLCAAEFDFDPVVETITVDDPLAGAELVTEVPIEDGVLPEQVDLSGLRDGPAILCIQKTAGPGVLYGAHRDGGVFTVDLQTGHAAPVGQLPIGTTEIEYDPRTGRAFAQAPDGAFFGVEFDIHSGAPIGSFIANDGSYTGLEWVNDALYGAVIRGPGGPSELRILNPFTGSSTLVGPTGTGPISGLAFHAATGTMYGIRGGSGPAALLTLNLATGVATTVGSTGIQAGSLEFGPDGLLYAGGTGSSGGQIFRIDRGSGAATLVGPTGFASVTGLALAGAAQVADCQPFTRRGERFVAINGASCGQAPTAVITPGSLQVECESAAGALVTLDGSASFDPDSTSGTNDDIVAYRWFEDFGLPSQRLIGQGATLQAQLPLGAHVLTLEVTDRTDLTGTAGATRTVADTLPPQVSLLLSPGALWPPNHNMVAVHASVSAVDRCGAASVLLSSLTSDEADDAAGTGDGATVGDIQDAGLGLPDDQFLLRAERSAAGDGRAYEVIYLAADSAGNAATATSVVRVPLTQFGVSDPVKLTTHQTAQGTQLRWDPVPGALFYNAIRGQLANIRERSQTIDLGPVICLESRSADATTGQFEDGGVPAVGTAFFYLVEYNDGLPSSYGEESISKPRVVESGDCH